MTTIKAIPSEECKKVIENFARRIQVCSQRQEAHLEHFLSSNKSKTFYSIDLILLSVLKPNILLMYVTFYNLISETLEIIQTLVMIVFFWVTL